MIALLGRRDAPTDGLEDYCTCLGRALLEREYRLDPTRVPWREVGWSRALIWLWRESVGWRGRWVLVQYTAMSWSKRGFPFWLLALIAILRWRTCRVAVVFHDPSGFPGARVIDRVRRVCQQWVMRTAYRLADRVILNVPVDRASWLPRDRSRAAFVPVGSNVPRGVQAPGDHEIYGSGGKATVAVFGVTGGEKTAGEVADIASAVEAAAERVGPLRLVVLGRGSREAEPALRRAFNGAKVEVAVLGLLPAAEVSCVLSQADVLLFVRGALSSQRTSGIAGIACGLPIVGYQGAHTARPVLDAGVMLVPYGDRSALRTALADVLSDRTLRDKLRERSTEAYRRYFSWDVIARRYEAVLGL